MEIIERVFLMQDLDTMGYYDQFQELKTNSPPILSREEIIKKMDNFWLI